MERADDADRLRVIADWQPGAWVGAVRRAFGPVAEFDDDDPDASTLIQHPAMSLIALWRPQTLREPFLRRWPLLVQLTAHEGRAAIQQLLAEVPAPARLWLLDTDLDWGLLAEIVLRSEEDLAPWQRRELAHFIAEQREATAATIRLQYIGDQGAGPEGDDRFSATVPVSF